MAIAAFPIILRKEASVHSPLDVKTGYSPVHLPVLKPVPIETCIANKVDTKEYLEYIFKNMSQEDSLKDDAVLEKYLPWNVALPTE